MMQDDGTAIVPTEGRKDEPAPGSDLTKGQRELAEAIVIDGLSARAAAIRCAVPVRTGQDWAHRPDVQRYIEYLVSEAVASARATIRAKFANAAPTVADTVVAMAEGKDGKKGAPYQEKYAQMVLERILGRPGQGPAEVGVKVPTEKGDVVIIWKSRD